MVFFTKIINFNEFIIIDMSTIINNAYIIKF